MFDPGGKSGTKRFLSQYFCFSPVSTIPLLLYLIILILLLSKGQVHGAWELPSKATPFLYREALATKLTHCGRVTQICVFTLQLCKTDDANLRF